jgi:DNA-binding phage protein
MMTEKLVLKKWDSASHLKTTADMVAYFDACLQENDPALVSHAVGVIARAKGLVKPTIFSVCDVLGVRLHVEPV